jgi:hypothetical protein
VQAKRERKLTIRRTKREQLIATDHGLSSGRFAKVIDDQRLVNESRLSVIINQAPSIPKVFARRPFYASTTG